MVLPQGSLFERASAFQAKSGGLFVFFTISLKGLLVATPAATTRGWRRIFGFLYTVADARSGLRPTAVGDGEGDRVRSICREDVPDGYGF